MGQADGEGSCIPRRQHSWGHCPQEGRPCEEQDRQDCKQEAIRERKEALCIDHRQVDRGLPKGSEGAWVEGLRCHQEGLSVLQEGKGVLQSVSAKCEPTPASHIVRRRLLCSW